jgi:hypothetical protein
MLLKGLVKKIAEQPYTDDEAMLMGLRNYSELVRAGPNYVAAGVRGKRISQNSEIQAIVRKIKLQIQRPIAKYSGA